MLWVCTEWPWVIKHFKRCNQSRSWQDLLSQPAVFFRSALYGWQFWLWERGRRLCIFWHILCWPALSFLFCIGTTLSGTVGCRFLTASLRLYLFCMYTFGALELCTMWWPRFHWRVLCVEAGPSLNVPGTCILHTMHCSGILLSGPVFASSRRHMPRSFYVSRQFTSCTTWWW